MIGRALVAKLSAPSVLNSFRPEIYTLVRRQPANDREVWWDPYEARIDLKKCEGMDAVVHLAGENEGGGGSVVLRAGKRKKSEKQTKFCAPLALSTARGNAGALAAQQSCGARASGDAG